MTVALAQLEAAERDLVAQEAEAATQLASIQLQLAATREAIAGMRKVAGPVPDQAARRAPARASTAVPPALVRGHHGAAAAATRGTRILRLIAAGTRATVDLRAAVPVPQGATAHQHRQSVANTLTRLKADGMLVNREDGWALTSKGRRRAAKEEP